MRNNGNNTPVTIIQAIVAKSDLHKNSFLYKLLYTKAITHFRTFAALKLYA